MLNSVKTGDIVSRKSYNNDVVFIVNRVIKNKTAILTGLTTRLKADAYIEDLKILDKKEVEKSLKSIDSRIVQETNSKVIQKNSIFVRTKKIVYTGRILHLDGDKRYSEKSNIYYKKMGLNAIVRNIPENRQANSVNTLIERYNPDILVVTRA